MKHENSKPIMIKIEVCIDEDGDGYHAYCPALKGLHTYGATIKEARQNVKYAIQAYLTSVAKHNEPLPTGITQIPDNDTSCTERYSQNLELILA